MTDWEKVAGKNANRIGQLERDLKKEREARSIAEHSNRAAAGLIRGAAENERLAIIALVQDTSGPQDVLDGICEQIRERGEPTAVLARERRTSALKQVCRIEDREGQCDCGLGQCRKGHIF